MTMKRGRVSSVCLLRSKNGSPVGAQINAARTESIETATVKSSRTLATTTRRIRTSAPAITPRTQRTANPARCIPAIGHKNMTQDAKSTAVDSTVTARTTAMIKYIFKIKTVGLFMLLNCWIVGFPPTVIDILAGTLTGVAILLLLIHFRRRRERTLHN